MYTTPNEPEGIYLELQPATRIDVEQEDIVWEAATETVGAQRVGQENMQQDRSLRGQLPHKAENGARGGRQHQLLKFAAVVVIFLIAVTALVIFVIKWSESTNPEKDLPVVNCTTNTHLCNANAVCKNIEGSHICICNSGYIGNGKICADLDECDTGTDSCDTNAYCNNTVGYHNCTCYSGYTGNGATCTEIDECSTNTHNCATNAYCNNTMGFYNCTCNPGYTGNGTWCTDVDDCTDLTDNCDVNAYCNNTVGSFNCTCKFGFTGNGTTCADVDECTLGNFSCDNNAFCNNTVGSYNCTCYPEYTGNGTSCTDFDECAANTDNCDVNAYCNNTMGSFNCTCYSGYTGNGTTCTDADECLNNSHSCSENATCNNTEGSFNCSCKPGYFGNGQNCSDADECLNNSHNCSENSTCANTERSFNCSCRPGYIGNGHNCSEFSMNSTILHGNQYYLQHLHRFLASAPEVGEDSSWLLCYRASLHGWKAKTFHDRCDGKRNTVTIVQKGEYVFGGYTDIPWKSSGGYAETANAFIFSLNNHQGLAPFLSKVKPEKTQVAIYRDSSSGPVFGDDLVIYVDANFMNVSQARLGVYYPVPHSMNDGDTILKGPEGSFTPDEVELFYLDPSR